MPPAFGQTHGEPAPIFVTKILRGYRDWKLISVAHEEGNLNSFAAILGNDVAIKAYREGKLPFPDGTIIAALHYRHVPSEENNKVFGRSQSFVAGPPHKHSVYGQGLNQVRHDGWLGVRSLPRWQTWRRGVDENLLPLSQSDPSSRPCLHPLRTLIPRTKCLHRSGTPTTCMRSADSYASPACRRASLPDRTSRGASR